jgi:hypothetical protein
VRLNACWVRSIQQELGEEEIACQNAAVVEMPVHRPRPALRHLHLPRAARVIGREVPVEIANAVGADKIEHAEWQRAPLRLARYPKADGSRGKGSRCPKRFHPRSAIALSLERDGNGKKPLTRGQDSKPPCQLLFQVPGLVRAPGAPGDGSETRVYLAKQLSMRNAEWRRSGSSRQSLVGKRSAGLGPLVGWLFEFRAVLDQSVGR